MKIHFENIFGKWRRVKHGHNIFALTIVLSASGCVTLYKPNAIYSPLLKQKGDVNAGASIGMSGTGLYNLQASYALNDHLGIMADGMYHARTLKGGDSSVDHLNILFGEAGAGYFNLFGSKKNILFQWYGGGGYGSAEDKINSQTPNPEMRSRYFNLFLQPGIAYVSPYFEMSFDTRVNYVNLYSIRAYLYNKFEWWNTDFHFYSDTSLNFTLMEPTLTCKAGGKNLKGIFQMGMTIPVANQHAYFEVNTASMLAIPLVKISAGITYTFRRNK